MCYDEGDYPTDDDYESDNDNDDDGDEDNSGRENTGLQIQGDENSSISPDQCDLGKERGLFSGDCVNAPLVDHPSCFNQPEGTGIDILSPNTTNV